jgi:hypothetical protein
MSYELEEELLQLIEVGTFGKVLSTFRHLGGEVETAQHRTNQLP